MESRTALGKFPDPCCPQWAETNSTDGLGSLCPGEKNKRWVSVAGHTGCREKQRDSQMGGTGGARGHVALVGQQRGAQKPTLPCLLVLSETCRKAY